MGIDSRVTCDTLVQEVRFMLLQSRIEGWRFALCLGCMGVLGISASGVFAAGEESQPAVTEQLDWDAWQRLPVLHRGRIKPLDTFARAMVQTICGRESPVLAPPEAGAEAQHADFQRLFPGGRPRKFAAAELVFSWMVEPQRWEHVPFLAASQEQLRRDLLGLPLVDSAGNRLRYASPHDVASAVRLRQRLERLQEAEEKAAAAGGTLEPVGLDKKAADLWEAYRTFRAVSFHPLVPSSERTRFVQQMNEATRTWNELAAAWYGQRGDQGRQAGLALVLRQLGWLGENADPLAPTDRALDKLFEVLGPRGHRRLDIPLEDVEPMVAEVHRSAAQMARQLSAYLPRVHSQKLPLPPEQLDMLYVKLRGAASRAADLAQLVREAYVGLYDNGNALSIVPAMNAAALERNRDSAEDARRRLGSHAVILAQPWLGFHGVILGPAELVGEYPQAELQAARQAFEELKTAYLDRDAPDRPQRFAQGMDRFVTAVRALGEKTTAWRTEKLALRDPDEALLAATAYPPAASTHLEVFYNRLDPFTWSWVFSLAGLVFFALGFGPLRMAMFALGLCGMAAGQAMTLWGLGLRVAITGRAPVATMFETVVFVALVVALLGLWFTLLPLLAGGLRLGWRLTAMPLTPEARWPEGIENGWISPRWLRRANWALALPRVALGVAVFAALAKLDPEAPGYAGGYISLVPRSTFDWSALVTWIVGLGVLALAVYYLPRMALAAVLAPLTIPYHLRHEGLRPAMAGVWDRRPFAVAGCAVAFLAAFLACYVPMVDPDIFDKHMNPLAAALRDNFWLTSHVLSITASYGAGALAWGLGNIALVYYLFGRYGSPGERRRRSRQPEAEALVMEGGADPLSGRQPPEICQTLAVYIYKAMQVAVLLLALGTILGAVWADEAWGRFWGWDPKEVWALISLLVYLAVLHGRYTGWIGHFGLALGSVIGAASIVMAWYGVNFVLKTGLHSYGTGGGSGKWWVILTMVLNLAFAALAAGRYLIETRLPRPAAQAPGLRHGEVA